MPKIAPLYTLRQSVNTDTPTPLEYLGLVIALALSDQKMPHINPA